MNWSIQIVSWSLIIIVPQKLFQVEDESECNLQPWPTPTSSNKHHPLHLSYVAFII